MIKVEAKCKINENEIHNDLMIQVLAYLDLDKLRDPSYTVKVHRHDTKKQSFFLPTFHFSDEDIANKVLKYIEKVAEENDDIVSVKLIGKK